MKDVLFKTRDGRFEILRSDIKGVMRATVKRPIKAPTLIDSAEIKKGTMMPTGEVEEIPLIRLLTGSGPVELGPEHSEEAELFLSVHGYGEVKPWTASKEQLSKKMPKIVSMPN